MEKYKGHYKIHSKHLTAIIKKNSKAHHYKFFVTMRKQKHITDRRMFIECHGGSKKN